MKISSQAKNSSLFVWSVFRDITLNFAAISSLMTNPTHYVESTAGELEMNLYDWGQLKVTA